MDYEHLRLSPQRRALGDLSVEQQHQQLRWEYGQDMVFDPSLVGFIRDFAPKLAVSALIGGTRDMATTALSKAAGAAEYVAGKVTRTPAMTPLPGMTGAMPSEEAKKLLPEVPYAAGQQNAPEDILRSIVPLAASFGPIFGAFKSAGVGFTTSAALTAGVQQLAFFENKNHTLFDLAQRLGIDGPVTRFMQTGDDNEFVASLKAAGTQIGLTYLIAALPPIYRALRDGYEKNGLTWGPPAGSAAAQRGGVTGTEARTADAAEEAGTKVMFHGSPHKFSEFDASRIGSGEGAQAYGYGMYFAENPETATQYTKVDASTIPTPRRTFQGTELQPGSPEYHAGTLLETKGVGLAKARKEVEGWIEQGSPDEAMVEGWKKTLETLNKATKKSDFGVIDAGNVYHVEIPQRHVDNMLDWDKPLSDQPEHIQKVLSNVLPTGKLEAKDGLQLAGGGVLRVTQDPDFGTKYAMEFGDKTFKLSADDIPNLLGQGTEGRAIYGQLTATLGGDKAASEYLNAHGISGIKYLDAGSRAKGSGTYNYVLFDPSDARITHVNGEPVSKPISDALIAEKASADQLVIPTKQRGSISMARETGVDEAAAAPSAEPQGAAATTPPENPLQPPEGRPTKVAPETMAAGVAARIESPVELQAPRSPYRNLNINRIDASDDAKQVMDYLSETMGHPAAAPVSHAQTAAEALATDPKEVLTKVMGGSPSQLLGRAEMTRARDIHADIANSIAEQVRNGAAKGYENLSDLEVVEFGRNLWRYNALRSAVQGKTAELARTLNAQAIKVGGTSLQEQAAAYAGLAAEGATEAAVQPSANFILDTRHSFSREDINAVLNAYGGKDALVQLMKTIEQEAVSPEQLGMWARVGNWLHKGAENLVGYRVINLLWSPVTQSKNVTGNTVSSALAPATKFVGGIISQTPGIGSGEMYPGEAGAFLHGYFSNTLKSWQMAVNTWKTGETAFEFTPSADLSGTSSAEQGLRQDGTLSTLWDYIATIFRTPARILNTTDELFRSLNFHGEMQSLAYRQAMKEGVTGDEFATRVTELISKPNQTRILEKVAGLTGDERIAAFNSILSGEDAQYAAMWEKSIKFAQYQVYMDEMVTQIGKAAQSAQRTLIGRTAIPFFKITTNLGSRALETSPFFMASPAFWRNMAAGGAARDEAIATALIGSAIGVGFLKMIRDGDITGSGPSNPGLRKIYIQAGWKPYQMFGGNYQWLEPVALPISIMANMMDYYRYAPNQAQRENIAGVFATAVGDAIKDQPFARGISDIIHGYEAVKSGAESSQVFNNFVKSFSPAASAQAVFRRIGSDPRRQSAAGDVLQEAWNALRDQVPIRVFHDDLPVEVDMWGQEQGWDDRVGPDWFSPIIVSKYKADEATFQMAANYDAATAPKPLIPQMQYNGQRINLFDISDPRGQEWPYHDYKVAIGRARHQLINQQIKSHAFQQAAVGPPSQDGSTRMTRGDLLNAYMTAGKQLGEAQFIMAYKSELDRLSAIAAASGRPVTPLPKIIAQGHAQVTDLARRLNVPQNGVR